MRQIEVFSTGCPFCVEVIILLRRVTSNSELVVRNVRERDAADLARKLGLRSFPAVVIDGEVVPFDLFAALSRLSCDWNCPRLLGAG
ncbi:MAG: glutaredoxin family protein [Actinomycetota bacterium]